MQLLISVTMHQYSVRSGNPPAASNAVDSDALTALGAVEQHTSNVFGRIVMKSFLVGLGFGVGLGLLFAPMSGEETRNNLADRANDLASSARETYEQNRDR